VSARVAPVLRPTNMLSCAALCIGLAALTAASPLLKRAPIPPSQDPFYIPPTGWQDAANGAVLASRQVVTSLAQAVPLSTTLNITSYQVLYRTTGAVGDAQATVVTLLIPPSARKNQLVNYAIAYDTAEWDCSPSYALQPGTPSNGAVTQEEPLILGFLVAGWTVAVSDYEGPRAVYTNGHLEGRQFLHGVRAALNFPPAQLSADTQIAQVGYSGGAMASGWGAILSGTYAPELNIVGTAIGGVPVNVTAILQHLDGGPASGTIFAAIAGNIAAVPSFASTWNQIATSTGQAAVNTASTICNALSAPSIKNLDLESTEVQSAGAGFFSYPGVKGLFDSLTMGSDGLIPAAPVFYYQCACVAELSYATDLQCRRDWRHRGPRQVGEPILHRRHQVTHV